MRDVWSSWSRGIRWDTVAVTASLLYFFLAPGLSAPEVFTNSFYVQLQDGHHGRVTADGIAKRNGFQNLGPVIYPFISMSTALCTYPTPLHINSLFLICRYIYVFYNAWDSFSDSF